MTTVTRDEGHPSEPAYNVGDVLATTLGNASAGTAGSFTYSPATVVEREWAHVTHVENGQTRQFWTWSYHVKIRVLQHERRLRKDGTPDLRYTDRTGEEDLYWLEEEDLYVPVSADDKTRTAQSLDRMLRELRGKR